MGAGASTSSTEVTEAVSKASPEDLTAAMAALSDEQKAKLKAALGGDTTELAEKSESPMPVVKPAGPSLLDQLNMMAGLAGDTAAANAAKSEEIKKATTRQRRKSRDLEQEVFGMHITDKEKLKKIFDQIDKDGSGELDVGELRTALEKTKPGETITDLQVSRRINKYDADGNGTLSFPEYEAMLKNWETDDAQFEQEAEKMQSVFEAIDLDKSGNIDKNELLAALKMIDKVATAEQVEKRINKYDVDKDGQVNFEEFEKMLSHWGQDEALFKTSS